MKNQEKPLEPALYMVATPIGNLGDLSERALNVLKSAHWIAAEDTRITSGLLHHYGIQTKLVSFHEHSDFQLAADLIAKIRMGEIGAYVSDAGTPGVSDPGAALVRAAESSEVKCIPIPGASALTALLSVSGFTSSGFTFTGFFPRENAERGRWLKAAMVRGGIVVFFESPHRIEACLDFLEENCPQECPVVLGRELTKKFETILRGKCGEIRALLSENTAKGEFVLAIDFGEPLSLEGLQESQMRELLRELKDLGADHKVLTKVAQSHGLAKKAAYALALEVYKP